MKGLAAAGHNVTVISPYPQTKPLANFRDIPLLGLEEAFVGKCVSFIEYILKL